MTAIASFRTQLVTAIQAQIPTVQVLPAPPAEDQALEESIWVDELVSDFEWRCIGPAASNRKETLTGELRVHVYREGSDQMEVSLAANDRCAALFAEIEDAFEADFSLAGSVTHGLPRRWSIRLVPRDQGWVADGRVTLEADNYPT